jgi:hypothetical protein
MHKTYAEKIKQEYLDYFKDANRDSNRKKLFCLREDIGQLEYTIQSTEDRIKDRLKNESIGWVYLYGEKYSQFDLEKTKIHLIVAKVMYKQLKK